MVSRRIRQGAAGRLVSGGDVRQDGLRPPRRLLEPERRLLPVRLQVERKPDFARSRPGISRHSRTTQGVIAAASSPPVLSRQAVYRGKRLVAASGQLAAMGIRASGAADHGRDRRMPLRWMPLAARWNEYFCTADRSAPQAEMSLRRIGRRPPVVRYARIARPIRPHHHPAWKEPALMSRPSGTGNREVVATIDRIDCDVAWNVPHPARPEVNRDRRRIGITRNKLVLGVGIAREHLQRTGRVSAAGVRQRPHQRVFIGDQASIERRCVGRMALTSLRP